MIPDLSKANIYIVCGRTDLRKGIDGLATLVTEAYKMDVFETMPYSFSVAPVRIASRHCIGPKVVFCFYTSASKTGICSGLAIAVKFAV